MHKEKHQVFLADCAQSLLWEAEESFGNDTDFWLEPNVILTASELLKRHPKPLIPEIFSCFQLLKWHQALTFKNPLSTCNLKFLLIFSPLHSKAALKLFWLPTSRGYFCLNSLILSLLIDVSKQMLSDLLFHDRTG